MKKFSFHNTKTKKTKNDFIHREAINQRIQTSAGKSEEALYSFYSSSPQGLLIHEVDDARDEYGSNVVTQKKKKALLLRIAQVFVNPFTAILMVLAVVSLFTDYIWAAPEDKSYITVVIITSMVFLSGMLRFIQETRSGNAAAKLSEMIRTTTCVDRFETGKNEIPLEDVVVGDIVHLSAGDMIPADMRILFAKDLFISQSSLTGESEPVEKYAEQITSTQSLTEYSNLVFMGTTVISGSAKGMILAVGDDTLLGETAKSLSEKPPITSFEKGINSVSWVLIRFMLVMVPVVLFINGFTKGDWLSASLFAISVAVGLTPEMLPMIVTTCLAKGAVSMSREKVIIENLNSIQNLGAMDILCTDKTGTLTQDKVVLEYHLDIQGNEDIRVLRHGFLNSYFQTGLKNLMDLAIIEHTMALQLKEESLNGIQDYYQKVDEIPFDFDRRRMSVVVCDENNKTQLITKGAVEEMLSICSFAEYKGEVQELTQKMRKIILAKVDELNESGMRVIAVAQKTNPSPVGAFSVADESNMVLIGYLAFLDPPKETTAQAIIALHEHGVEVKVLTGDNDKVTCCICRQVGLKVGIPLLGEQVELMSDDELSILAETTTIFAKLSPSQKARIVRLLRKNGHSVGYMGDGINDAAAMQASDVGISVDTAVDIAKESADVILLEKDLMVLEKGIIEGRKTYANMIKYIKMTASSNFGNMFSVLAASAFLPFLPMASIHIILLNLIYDIACTAIPWDNVDKEFLVTPKKWDASSVSKFMLWIGPTSSIFDIFTYLLMYFIICPALCGGQLFHQITNPGTQALYIAIFQTGWFVESMWSQTLVIHMIRTPKIPFIQSRASAPVTLLTLLGIIVLTIIPYTPFGTAIGLTALPLMYFGWLIAIIMGYMILATLVKMVFVKRYGELL